MDSILNNDLFLSPTFSIPEEIASLLPRGVLLQKYMSIIDEGTLQLDLQGTGRRVHYLNPFNPSNRPLRLPPPQLLNPDAIDNNFIGEDSLHFSLISSQNEFEAIANDVEQIESESNNDGEIVPFNPPPESLIEQTTEDDDSSQSPLLPNPPPPEASPPPRKMSRKLNLDKVLAQPHPPPPLQEHGSPPPDKKTRRKQNLAQVRQDSSSQVEHTSTRKKKKLYECDPDDPTISKATRDRILHSRKMEKFHSIKKEKAKKFDTLQDAYTKLEEENKDLKEDNKRKQEEIAQLKSIIFALGQENETKNSPTASSTILGRRRRQSK